MPIRRIAFVIYLLAAAGFALFYPRRRAWSLPAFGLCIVLAVGIWAFAYQQRATRGEYARPTFIFLRWIPAGGALVIDEAGTEWIDVATRALLEQSRIEGQLQLLLADGGRENLRRVIVLLQRPPMVAYRLYHPRQGALVHAFDGAEWRTFPPDVPTYPLFSSLAPTPEGELIFSQTVEGSGTKSSTVGNW